MKNLRHIRSNFVRQITSNDCGIAALAMILHYAGKNDVAATLRGNPALPKTGISLLAMRNLAGLNGLSARCVQMEIDFLRNNRSPCILHMTNGRGNNHFQVCYGARKRLKRYEYLMADPARQVYYLGEKQLLRQWASRAALYFPELPPAQKSGTKLPGHLLSLMKDFPKGLLIGIPLLNICAVFLGLTLSWLLQRGMNDPLVAKKGPLVVAIVLLLLIATLAKGLFSYLRQRILIRLNYTVNQRLVLRFIEKVLEYKDYYGIVHNLPLIKSGFLDIQKIQHAVAVFLSVLLSDGLLILLILSGISYYLPFAGLISLGYLFIVTVVTIRRLPGLLYDYAALYELSGITENSMTEHLAAQRSPGYDPGNEDNVHSHHQNHIRYLNAANTVAVKISKMTFLYDCIGTVNIILIFVYGQLNLYRQKIDYSSFVIMVIMSYFITNIMPRVCNALFVITEGIDASHQYKAWLPKE